MATRIAFVRGINVGGKASVPMADLRAALTDRGFQNVRTYIQSGNVVYDAPKGARSTKAVLSAEAATIVDTIKELRGLAPVVMVRAATDVARHHEASPYGSADPSQAFLVFMDGDVAGLGELDRYATSGEEWKVIDGVLHLHCPNGLGRSKLGERLAGSKQVPTTTRNLRTIAKIVELART